MVRDTGIRRDTPGWYVQERFPNLDLKRCSEKVQANVPGPIENPVDMFGQRAGILDDPCVGPASGKVVEDRVGTGFGRKTDPADPAIGGHDEHVIER